MPIRIVVLLYWKENLQLYTPSPKDVELREMYVLLHLWLFHCVGLDGAMDVVMSLHKDLSGGLSIGEDSSNRKPVQVSDASPWVRVDLVLIDGGSRLSKPFSVLLMRR